MGTWVTSLLLGLALTGCGGDGGDDTGDAAAGDADAGAATDAGGTDGTVSGDGGGGDGALPVDPCATRTPVCPQATAPEGGGVVAIDRCAFPLREAASFTTLAPLVTALEALAPHASLADVLGDLNRVATATTTVPGGPAGVAVALRWNTEDDDATTWIPQGLTGSADASASGLVGGRRVVLVSWYYTPPAGSTYEKGVRIAFVDVTDAQAPRYRFALLVTPTGTAQAPSLAPVTLHAGGIVWYGNYLYVVETSRGFRVFDLSRMLELPTDVDEIGCSAGSCRAGLYKYAIPQIGAYTSMSTCSPLFSYVSLDRSTTPPSLLSGEYCSATACSAALAGRALRWPLDAASGRLRAGTSWPSEAVLLGQRQVQGAASRAGTFYLSSSAPAGGAGALYRVAPGKSATSTWIDAPEDLMVDGPNGLLWSLSEGAGARAVFGARLTSYPPP